MCGIVGYIGKRDAYPVLIKGLKRLEYRGYDSAGVALIDKKRRLNVYKTKGKVSDLEAFVSQKDVSGTIGIAHIRWTTHAEPCQANAHPHFSSSQNLALIPNGIIENYATLKEKLQNTGQVTVLTMLALTLAKEKRTMPDRKRQEVIRELMVIPAKIKKILQSNQQIAELSRIFTYAHNFLYLGRGYSFPVALEGALKLKEISYIHAEGYPAAEMKHGPIALIDTEMPVIVVATHNAMYEKIISNIQEIKARKGKVIALVTEGDTVISKLADDCIELPETLECLEPLIATIPLQLLAYHVAICKGKNVDQPRNLAKSVTVE